MKKCHRTVFQNAWSQKNKHSHWKNNSASKKLTNSYEKIAQKRLLKCLKPKKPTLSLKKQFCFKKACKLIWKKATEPSSKMPEAKKTNTHWKNKSASKKLTNSNEKRAQNRLPKCLEPKKNALIEKPILLQKSFQNHMKKGHGAVFQNAWSQKKPTLSLKKQFCFKKAYKFIWKKGTEPSSKMPEAKKTNTPIEKTILFQKSL